MRRGAAWLAALVLACACGAAAEEPDVDDLLEGFEEAAPEPSEPARPAGEEWLPGWLDVQGALSFQAAYGLIAHRTNALPYRKSWQGPNKLRNQLDLQLDADLPAGIEGRVSGFAFYDPVFALRDRREYTHEVLEVYERDAELDELWLRGSPHEHVDLKIGRQIVNWGRSETLRVIDVINPLDLRDPGLVDIENLRRPVGMLKADAFAGDWSLTGLVIPEIREDLLPPFGSDYVASPVPLPPSRRPAHWGDDPEFGGALAGRFHGWDLSFHALRYWTNAPRLAALPPAVPGPPLLEFRYDRQTLVGSGGSLALGNWLLKAEIAWIDGVRFTNADESDRIDVMGGVEYYGFDDASIALEIADRHLTHWERAAKRAPDWAEEDEPELALRANVDLMNARLHLLGVVLVRGEHVQRGVVTRLQATWELRDAVALTGGLLLYAQGDVPPTDGWGDNDRLFTELRWSF